MIKTYSLILLVVAMAVILDVLWSWFPAIGVAAGLSYLIGRWSATREVRSNERAKLR